MSIQTTTLKNGLRVVTDEVNTVESVAVGIWCDVGTRHEDMAHNGVAHMVEHMMFNGTPTRSSKDIVEQIETVGGQMNAFTSREMTAYYVHLLKEDVALGLDVLSDMLQRSTFPDTDLEKERGVIIQEIGMTNEQNLVISTSGNISHDQMVKLVEKFFIDLPDNQDVSYKSAAYEGGDNRIDKDLEQSHIVLGFQGVQKDDPNYYAATLLSTVMGGGMSSRLFQEVREKHGLVYSVYSSHSGFIDDGQFEIYAGTGPDKLQTLIPVLCDEVKKISNDLVSADELNRAKSQLRAGILMGRESMLSRANRQAKHLISFNEAFDLGKLLAKIEAVSPQDVHAMAARIFAGKPTIAALGPLKELDSYDKIQSQLAA